MPRNRQGIDREAKVEEILSAGETALREGGYDALTFNGIAKELGLARGAIYWYFKSKDELLVAVVSHALARAFADPPSGAGYEKRITWAVDRLAEVQPLNAAVHERARHSDVVAEFEASMQKQLCDRLREVLRPHVPSNRLEDVAQSVVVFVQGLLALPLTQKERRRRLRFLLGSLVAA